jgi:hypothetical protein
VIHGRTRCEAQCPGPPQSSKPFRAAATFASADGTRIVQYPAGGARCPRLPTKSCRRSPTTSGWVEIAASDATIAVRSIQVRGRVAASAPSGTATSNSKTTPPATSDAVTAVARPIIGPTSVASGRPNTADDHEVPKSPWRARQTYFPYCTYTGWSTPSWWRAFAIWPGEACWTSTRNPAGSAGILK